MKITRQTLSLCPTCYLQIPATVYTKPDGVLIEKECPTHGKFLALLERDHLFYEWVKRLQSPSIYSGHFIDVTRRCNLRCSYCYYPLEKEDPTGLFSIDRIVNECRVNAGRGPFILTGGDPTLHPNLADLISSIKQVGPVALLSNGVKLADRGFFGEIMPLITDEAGQSHLNLSLHTKETNTWKQVIEHCRSSNMKIYSCLIVIDSREQFHEALKRAKSLRDVVLQFRIKAATNLWNETGVSNQVFVSDMIQWLEELGGAYAPMTDRHNKPVFLNVAYEGIHLMLVSWNDVHNVDLCEINCPPTYRARNGEVLNFVTASLVNDGMKKGWLNGVRIK